MTANYDELRRDLEAVGQEQVLRFWDDLDEAARNALAEQLSGFDPMAIDELIREWILDPKAPIHFTDIQPMEVIAADTPSDSPDARAAFEAGEAALRAGRVGLLLVAGGQGTRLGFDGPKGAYPVGPITGRTLFHYQADKIHSVQERYDCILPWYIMVGETNEEATRTFFEGHDYFGLDPANVRFFKQRMMPCISDEGKWLLDAPGRVASNPNGHGGSIAAIVESGIAADARARGIDTLSFFQVDNWAVNLADPLFIGYHVLRKAEVSSKVCAKNEPREKVGVHCLCDGVVQVIEYTELDLYPQLLETDSNGKLLHFAGNTAIHVFDLGFIEQLGENFRSFPWHCSHKKVPYLDAKGTLVEPESENGHKFETFVFDALRYVSQSPVALEIQRPGEYTPIKQFSGANSVEAARESMNAYWAQWIEAAGGRVARDAQGKVAVDIEINPRFARTEDEFVAKMDGKGLVVEADTAIDAEGRVTIPESADSVQ